MMFVYRCLALRVGQGLLSRKELLVLAVSLPMRMTIVIMYKAPPFSDFLAPVVPTVNTRTKVQSTLPLVLSASPSQIFPAVIEATLLTWSCFLFLHRGSSKPPTFPTSVAKSIECTATCRMSSSKTMPYLSAFWLYKCVNRSRSRAGAGGFWCNDLGSAESARTKNTRCVPQYVRNDFRP